MEVRIVPVERDIFLAALEITDLEERAAFLDSACPDPRFRSRVERSVGIQSGTYILAGR